MASWSVCRCLFLLFVSSGWLAGFVFCDKGQGLRFHVIVILICFLFFIVLKMNWNMISLKSDCFEIDCLLLGDYMDCLVFEEVAISKFSLPFDRLKH